MTREYTTTGNHARLRVRQAIDGLSFIYACNLSIRYFDTVTIFVTVIEDFKTFFFTLFTAMPYPFLASRKEKGEAYPGNLQPVVGADDKEDRRSKEDNTDKKRSPDKLYGGR